MSSSSSDDGYDAELLREAIATEFISDDIYKGSIQKRKFEEKPKLKSLRPNKDDEDNQFNGAEVTMGFRNHVAKHLMKMLDESIKEKIKNNDLQQKRIKHKGGVRLFSDSNCVIKKIKIEQQTVTNIKKSIDSDSEEREEKVKSVAVDVEHILSKNEIKNWSKRSKAPVFHYKSNKQKLYLTKQENIKHNK